jgi:hypothetical protein
MKVVPRPQVASTDGAGPFAARSAARHGTLASGGVKPQIGETDDRMVLFAGATSEQRSNAGEQLVNRERLH